MMGLFRNMLIFAANILTSPALVGYCLLVTAKSVAGLVARCLGGYTAASLFLAVFLCPLFMTTLFLGGVMGGAERLAGPKPGLPTSITPPFFRLVASGWENIIFRLGEKS
jgi:hypothetical protein